MTISRSEDLLVGAIGLVLLPMIGWRIARGLKEGRLPVYRTYLDRSENEAKFRFLLAVHAVSFLLIAFVTADLLFGLNLKDRL